MPDSYLNRDQILAPISDSKPVGTNYETGEDVALGRAFSELRSLLSLARRIEAKRFDLFGMLPSDKSNVLASTAGSIDGPQSDPNWRRIAELSVEILTKHSKDTRAMVSLIESMIRLRGLPGLQEAISVCADAVEKFGLTLFPEAETPSEQYYALQFFRMMTESDSNNLKSAIYQSEVFPDRDGYSWYSHFTATSLERRPIEEKEEFLESGAVTLEDFNQVQQSISSVDELGEFDRVVSACLEEVNRFDSVLSGLSKSTMGIGNLRDYLAQVLRWYRSLTSDRMESLKSEMPAETHIVEVEDESQPDHRISIAKERSASIEAHSISNREQAFASLLRVAAYFREAEPHSPVSYALEQAVRWGKLPLPELLRDLVADERVLSDVFRRMGIHDPE